MKYVWQTFAVIFLWGLILVVAANSATRCYDATVFSVYDGDTFIADLDLGFDLVIEDQRVRILEIDAPEIRPLSTREEATRVRDILAERIEGMVVEVCTGERERDAFGRVLADVYHDGIDVGQWLLDQGLVVPYE